MAETAVQLPPLKMHARKPSRFDYAYALCNEIEAGDLSPTLREAVESIGAIAADVGSSERNAALQALRKIRARQLGG